MAATGTVVVGADGSPAARTAIEYALQDAERRGAGLRIVAAAGPATQLRASDGESGEASAGGPRPGARKSRRGTAEHVSVGLYCVLHASCPVTTVRQAPLAEQLPTIAAAQA